MRTEILNTTQGVSILNVMAKQKSATKNPVRKSREKIENTPFKSVSEMNAASHEIHRGLWQQLEKARIMQEMMETDRFGFVKDELRAGLNCTYGETQDKLVKVFSEGTGIQIVINADMVKDKDLENSEAFIESIIKATAETFSKSYYAIKGMIPVSVTEPQGEIEKFSKK